MTRREKVLATTLLSLLGIMGGGFLFHLFVYEPMSDVRGQLDIAQAALLKKRGELAQEQKQIENILRINPRLSQWQKISLPPRDPTTKKPGVPPEEQKRKHLAQMQVEYERYLSELLRSNGFRSDSIDVTTRQPDRRATPATPKGKEPVYERLAFGVKGKGTLDNVQRMLRDFHRAPLLHQVRSLSLSLPTATSSAASKGRSSAGLLEMTLGVEAMLVTGAEERSSLLPSKLAYQPRVLAEPTRDYGRMVKKNMFTGIDPPPPPPPPPVKPVSPPKQSEDKADLLRFVKVTSIFYNADRKRWEATLYDQAAGPRRVQEEDDDGVKRVKVIWEQQINTRILNELNVYDRYKNPMIEATVVHIDEDQIILKEKDKYYRLRCGDSLYQAVEKPISSAEVKKLGIAVK